MPWPLLASELDPLSTAGLRQASFEDYIDQEDPPTRRFRFTFDSRGA